MKVEFFLIFDFVYTILKNMKVTVILNFYEFFTDKKLQRNFELAKDVIANV
ncbi:hypothetical protein CoNPh26_CDS0060 [Staphylococcus phage S-CoN_Ph26]|nr:hypothetical protein CoNPh26_CDS0060 [Staphylococcus phage S-CoN_Ph26]